MSVSDICVTKDYNRNVLRFTVPCDHPALDASRVMRAQSGSPGVAAGPVPSWILTIGSMVVVPSGPAHSDTMVNLAKKAIAEAEQAGEHRHASALRALGTQAVQHAKSTRTQHTTQLKASFVEYAAAARRQEHLRSQARMLTASKRQARACTVVFFCFVCGGCSQPWGPYNSLCAWCVSCACLGNGAPGFFVVGEVVRTRFGAGRLVEHRVHNDMCIVDLSFGRASVPRAELFPIDDGQDAFRPVIDADTLANGAGGSCGSASVPRGAAGGVSAPAGSPEPQVGWVVCVLSSSAVLCVCALVLSSVGVVDSMFDAAPFLCSD